MVIFCVLHTQYAINISIVFLILFVVKNNNIKLLSSLIVFSTLLGAFALKAQVIEVGKSDTLVGTCTTTGALKDRMTSALNNVPGVFSDYMQSAKSIATTATPSKKQLQIAARAGYQGTTALAKVLTSAGLRNALLVMPAGLGMAALSGTIAWSTLPTVLAASAKVQAISDIGTAMKAIWTEPGQAFKNQYQMVKDAKAGHIWPALSQAVSELGVAMLYFGGNKWAFAALPTIKSTAALASFTQPPANNTVSHSKDPANMPFEAFSTEELDVAFDASSADETFEILSLETEEDPQFYDAIDAEDDDIFHDAHEELPTDNIQAPAAQTSSNHLTSSGWLASLKGWLATLTPFATA